MGDYLIGAVILLIVAGAVWKIIRDKRNKKGCSCGSSCPGCGDSSCH